VTLDVQAVIASLLAPGKEGPLSGQRFEMIREGAQEAEARVFVQNALLDEAARAKLPAELADRANKLCNKRTRTFRHFSEYYLGGATEFFMSDEFWRQPSLELYQMAAEVAKALK
jgi:hypothetical protein